MIKNGICWIVTLDVLKLRSGAYDKRRMAVE